VKGLWERKDQNVGGKGGKEEARRSGKKECGCEETENTYFKLWEGEYDENCDAFVARRRKRDVEAANHCQSVKLGRVRVFEVDRWCLWMYGRKQRSRRGIDSEGEVGIVENSERSLSVLLSTAWTSGSQLGSGSD
jgi:hypothetical protein